MSDDTPVLTEDELSALWAEIGRDAALAEAMDAGLRQKLRQYEYERARASGSNVRHLRAPGEDHPQFVRPEFRPRTEPWPERGPDEHGNGGDDLDPSSL